MAPDENRRVPPAAYAARQDDTTPTTLGSSA